MKLTQPEIKALYDLFQNDSVRYLIKTFGDDALNKKSSLHSPILAEQVGVKARRWSEAELPSIS